MAAPLDVAARLAEGQPAVDDVEAYVAACRRLGYQHPDLTAGATPVRDRYAAEDGLDLRALDADCAVLATLAAAAEDAARMQTDLVAQLAGAWSGRGASAAHEFTWRSGRAATSVGVAIRAAADASAMLRDALWRAVDAKVAAVSAIDGRHRAQRAEWLAAAATVTTGAGDLAAASELVDQQVKPFVHDDIGTDWVGAMRAAAASIHGAYDASLAAMAAPPPSFDVPGELGPRAEPPVPVVIPAGAASNPAAGLAIPTAAPIPMAPPSPGLPAAATPPAGVLPPPDPWVPAPAASAVPAPTGAATPPVPSLPAMGDLGAGTSALGGGSSGFGQQLADLIGGLIGSADGAVPDESDPVDEPDEPDESDSAEDDPAAEEVDGDPDGPVEELAPQPMPEPEPAPTAVPPPPPPPGPLPASPEAAIVAAQPTPCEIAADELPQVGE